MQFEMDAHRNIERNIVKEIMRECYPKKIYPNENFVSYFIKLLLLDPNWGITDDFLTSRENVAKFVAHVISELEATKDAKLITLQMQFYFTCNMENINNVVKRQRAEILQRVVRLKEEIFNLPEPESQEEFDNLIKMIVFYATLVSGLGNPLEAQVYLEALSVFKSVMYEDELKEFTGFSTEDKEYCMTQVTKVLTGIRLFNRDDEKGGAGIQDLPNLLDKAVNSLKHDVQKTLKDVMNKVNILTTIVDKCYLLEEEEEEGNFHMVCKIPSDVEDVNMDSIKDILIFYRQSELFIRKVIEALQKIEKFSNQIFVEFQTTLREVYSIVNVKIAIPARMVFPYFESLADAWTELQNQVMILARYSKIVTNITNYSKNIRCNKDTLDSLLDNNPPQTDAERLEQTSNLAIRSKNPNVEVTRVNTFRNIDDIKLQYLGFCSWKLVETKGGLIPGNPSMGVATYKDKNYVFSIPEACKEFSKKPEELVNEALDLGRKKPHLINFLLIKEELEQAMNIGELAKAKGYVKLTQDKKVQTLDSFHGPDEPKTRKTYYWNVWDYKREALQFVYTFI